MLACQFNTAVFPFSVPEFPGRAARVRVVLYEKPAAEQCVEPKYHVSADDTEALLQVELPGVAKEDIVIECEPSRLTLTAKKQVVAHVEQHQKGNSPRRSSPSLRYKLQLPLGKLADVDAISTASYRDGVLTVHIPAVKTQPPRRIDIPQ